MSPLRASTRSLAPRRRRSTRLFSELPTLDWSEALLRLVLAGILGGLIGVERELREREAGLRTHLLVSVGSALFTIVSAYGFHEFLASGQSVVRADPTRIAAQIVTGIGFLGAGAIITQGVSIRGLTTAATLWVTAAIGMAVGAGYYSGAAITTAVVILSLWPLRIIAYRMLSRFRVEEARLLVELRAGGSTGAVIDRLERTGARIETIEVSQSGGRRRLELGVELPSEGRTPAIVAGVADVDDVVDVRWSDV